MVQQTSAVMTQETGVMMGIRGSGDFIFFRVERGEGKAQGLGGGEFKAAEYWEH